MRPEIGRPQLGELQIEFGLAYRGVLRRDRRLGHVLGLDALIERLLRDGRTLDEALAALQVAFGERQIGLRLRLGGLGLIQRGFEGSPVDGEQQIARFHDLAVR